MKYDVAIVGGGAAGLSCAVNLTKGEKKLNILIIDAGERLGKKIAASGNGQGNITNLDMSAAHYFGGKLKLVESIIAEQDTESNLFHCVLTADGGRVYPGGKQASALVDSLMGDLNRAGVEILLGTKVTNISNGFVLELSDGRKVQSKYVVLAVGGKAQKQFKTDGSSYALAENFGHKITPLYPSLVQLKTDTEHIKTLKGIRADCIVTALQNGKAIAEKRGDVIFTEYGISGNAVFAISPHITDKPDITLSLEFLPEVKEETLISDIQSKKNLGYQDSELLSGTLHNQIGRAIMRRAKTSNPAEIVNLLKNFTLKVTGTLGFDYAQVTKGGVDMNGVTENLESKYAKNLFFAGEVLDIDGECGGYNLHWAFSSGKQVAKELLKRC